MMNSTYEVNCLPDSSPLMKSLKAFLNQTGHEQLDIFEQEIDGNLIDYNFIFSLFTPLTKAYYDELIKLSVSKENAIKKVIKVVVDKVEIEQHAVVAALLNEQLIITYYEEEILNEKY